jgi:hypothetical protein
MGYPRVETTRPWLRRRRRASQASALNRVRRKTMEAAKMTQPPNPKTMFLSSIIKTRIGNPQAISFAVDDKPAPLGTRKIG